MESELVGESERECEILVRVWMGAAVEILSGDATRRRGNLARQLIDDKARQAHFTTIHPNHDHQCQDAAE